MIMNYIYNEFIQNSNFPLPLKKADITPAHKKNETTNKENYRPVSILPSISKDFERNMYDQIYMYMNKHLSNYLCGFRKGYSTQYCLIVMLENGKKLWVNVIMQVPCLQIYPRLLTA